jgi:hypothetical protein
MNNDKSGADGFSNRGKDDDFSLCLLERPPEALDGNVEPCLFKGNPIISVNLREHRAAWDALKHTHGRCCPNEMGSRSRQGTV